VKGLSAPTEADLLRSIKVGSGGHILRARSTLAHDRGADFWAHTTSELQIPRWSGYVVKKHGAIQARPERQGGGVMANFHNYPRYIPVIKWQSWEQKALEKIDAQLRPRMQPCIEARTSGQHINLLSKLKSVWPHDVLVDYANPKGILTPVRQKELLEFLQVAIREGLPASPVVGPAYATSIGKPFTDLAAQLPSVAVRLRLESLALSAGDFKLASEAFAALNAAKISSSLIVDLGVSPKTWDAKVVTEFGNALKSLNAIGYRSIHLVSGAYPASLAAVKTGVAKFDRLDWAFWNDVNAQFPELMLGYGDYGTLSPEWTEDTLNLRGSRVAIRYTREDNWLIVRADGKTTDDSIAISAILVSSYPGDFKGSGYSFGDDLLAERADPKLAVKKKRCGHYHITEGWSHHIAYVLKEQY